MRSSIGSSSAYSYHGTVHSERKINIITAQLANSREFENCEMASSQNTKDKNQGEVIRRNGSNQHSLRPQNVFIKPIVFSNRNPFQEQRSISHSNQVSRDKYATYRSDSNSKPFYNGGPIPTTINQPNNSPYLSRQVRDSKNSGLLKKKGMRNSWRAPSEIKQSIIRTEGNLQETDEYIPKPNPPPPQHRFEYIPYQQRYVEIQPREVVIIEYVPVQRFRTNYYTVEHITEFQPRLREEIVVEMIPEEKITQKVQYQMVETKIVHYPQDDHIPTVHVSPITERKVPFPQKVFPAPNSQHNIWNPELTQVEDEKSSFQEPNIGQIDSTNDQPLRFEERLVTSNVSNSKFKDMFESDQPSFFRSYRKNREIITGRGAKVNYDSRDNRQSYDGSIEVRNLLANFRTKNLKNGDHKIATENSIYSRRG